MNWQPQEYQTRTSVLHTHIQEQGNVNETVSQLSVSWLQILKTIKTFEINYVHYLVCGNGFMGLYLC